MIYKKRKKTYLKFTIPFILWILCFIIYSIIWSDVAPDGTLIEPFFLIPIGELFILIWIIVVITKWIKKLFKK